MGCFGLRTWTMGTRTGRRPFSFCFHPPHRKAFHVSINRSGGSPLSSHHLQRQRDLLRVDVRPRFVCPGIGRAEAGPCELPHRRLHHENGASLAPVGSLGLRIRRNLYSAGSGASSARHHRLRIPPAMGEKELARASVSQRAVPLTHAKQRSFALETISASQKNERPRRKAGSGSSWSGRRDSNPRIQAWEAWALPLGDARMREANYNAPFPVREETHISTWLIGLPAEDAKGGFSHPPPDPRRSHYRNTRAD